MNANSDEGSVFDKPNSGEEDDETGQLLHLAGLRKHRRTRLVAARTNSYDRKVILMLQGAYKVFKQNKRHFPDDRRIVRGLGTSSVFFLKKKVYAQQD